MAQNMELDAEKSKRYRGRINRYDLWALTALAVVLVAGAAFLLAR